MAVSRTFSIGMAVLSGLWAGFGVTPARADVFDAARDFSPTANPDGVWSYGYSTSLGSPFLLYTSHGIFKNPNGTPTGLDSWNFDIGLGNPSVEHNGTGGVLGINGSTVYQPGQLGLHPGPGGEYSIVRFTAPAAATYALSSSFIGLDFFGPTSTDVHVLLDGASIFDGAVSRSGSGPSFSRSLALAPGDHLDFEVGYGANRNYFFDSTGLSATLSTAAVPEPGGFVLAALAAVVMAGYGVRQRRAS